MQYKNFTFALYIKLQVKIYKLKVRKIENDVPLEAKNLVDTIKNFISK